MLIISSDEYRTPFVDRKYELWSAAAVAFQSLSQKQRTLFSKRCQISSEVMWGWAVGLCDDPMYYEYIADATRDDEIALVAGTTLSRSDVRLKTAKYE